MPICHGWNTITHLNDYEGDPEARPFTREELQRFLDYADEQVERAVRTKRKARSRSPRRDPVQGGLRVGLRRTETSRLDVVDFGRNRQQQNLAGSGCCTCALLGKAVRGQPPRRRKRPVGDGVGGGGGR